MTMKNSSRDTRYTLVEWTGTQEDEERLSGSILGSEGYESVDPMHPLGGRDGTKDLKCSKNGIKFIGGCYFPRGQQTFAKISKKFEQDLKGVKKNNVEGFIFITNQEISVSQRKKLEQLSPYPVDIFHLERIIHVLNNPANFGIRLQYLDIEMTKEEMVAFIAWTQNKHTESLNAYMKSIEQLSKGYGQSNEQRIKVVDEEVKVLEEKPFAMNLKKGDVYLADLGKGFETEQGGVRPVVIVSNYINNRYSPTVTIVPVTGQITKAKLPTHVELGFLINKERESVVLVEQIKTISKKRLMQIITTLDRELIDEIDDSISIQMQLVDF
jgi:mRNA-degrading endonuclease toxin of MazEF toxin-antitoxin module